MAPSPVPAAPLPLLLVTLACLPDSVQAMAGDTTGVLTIVSIVIGCCVVGGGIAVIGWYCWKHSKKEQAVEPIKPVVRKPPPAPSPQPQMMLVAQSPMPGMGGYMIPAGGMMMGYPGMAPGTALYQVPVPQQQRPVTAADNTDVEDLEAGK